LRKERRKGVEIASIMQELRAKSNEVKRMKIILCRYEQENEEYQRYKELNNLLNKELMEVTERLSLAK
jgi:hypothetical protein